MGIHVLGFSGSLRQESYNTALLRAAGELLPDSMTLETFDLAPIPLYNEDVRREGFPVGVRQFRERIAQADALLIATPEYNLSISGVLKNAIDWASRPDDGFRPLDGKPVAIMGATTGAFGTSRAQTDLRGILFHTNCHVVNKPEVLLMKAKEKFDADLRLTDEASRGFLRDLLVALAEFAPKFMPERTKV